METGVTCEHGGGQTPLPDDLRVPTFTCRYCRRQLETARYAGESVVVDHQMAFTEEGLDQAFNPFWQPSGPMPTTKVLADVVRPCRRCGQPVTMSLMFSDATANCDHCGLKSTISDYLTEAQQGALRDEQYRQDMEALQRVRARGVECRTCGGHNPAPEAVSGQSVCQHCKAVPLLPSGSRRRSRAPRPEGTRDGQQERATLLRRGPVRSAHRRAHPRGRRGRHRLGAGQTLRSLGPRPRPQQPPRASVVAAQVCSATAVRIDGPQRIVTTSKRHRRFRKRPRARVSLAPTPSLTPKRAPPSPGVSMLPSYPPEHLEPPDVQELVMAFENLMALVDLYESLMDGSDLVDYDSRRLVEEARDVAEVEMLREFIPSRLRELECATRHPPAIEIKTGSR